MAVIGDERAATPSDDRRSKACRRAGATGSAARWPSRIAVAFSAFQLVTAAYGILPSQVVRAMHVGFLLLLGFGAARQPARQDRAPAKPGSGRSASLGFATGLYNWVFYAPCIHRSRLPDDRPTSSSASSLIVLVFEAARRLMGLPLADHLPASSSPTASSASTCRRRSIHRGYDFDQIVDHFAFGTEGIYGTPIYVSAAYIFLFVLFAAFLEQAGMIALFNDVALGAGRRAGAAARRRSACCPRR